MDKYKFGELIYTQRKKLGLTQEELGRRLKVTNKAVSKWETGETLPDVLLLKPLADELQISVDELLTQQKPEVKKVYIKPKIFPYIILSVVVAILIAVSALLATKLYVTNNKPLTIETVDEYFQINVCEQATLDEYELTINGTIEELKELKSAVTLTLTIDIQYYYLNDNDELCEILYYGRSITYDGSSSSFEIVVSPKNNIDDFKSFYGFNVSYKVVEAKEVYK